MVNGSFVYGSLLSIKTMIRDQSDASPHSPFPCLSFFNVESNWEGGQQEYSRVKAAAEAVLGRLIIANKVL